MTFKPNPQQEAGGQKRVWVMDDETRGLLTEILVELRINNTHLAMMTDSTITESDLQEG